MSDDKQIDETALIAYWREDIKKVHKYARNWDEEHGFLKGNRPDSLDALVQNVVTGKTSLPSNTIAAYVKEEKRRQPLADSVDTFINHYIHQGERKLQPNVPHDVYKRPILTSHRYGWGRNLEMFKDMNMHYR